MKVSVSHTFDCGPEAFWSKVFFDKEYNETLFLKDLGFLGYEIKEYKDTGDRIERLVKSTPPQKAPEFIRKVISGTLSYEERGIWTKADGIYRFKTASSVLTEKIKIEGSIRLRPAGENKIHRDAETDVNVSIFMVGGKVESFICDEVRASYEKSAAFTQRWITERKP